MTAQHDLFSLDGKVALITGGSRGLGRAMALGFAQAGATVVVASRKFHNCETVANEIERETGRAAMPYGVHVGRWDQLDGLVEAVYTRFGAMDVLVNNAGMSPVYDDLASVSEQLFDSVMNVNFKGPFRLAVLCADRMTVAGRGSIINISSSGSIRPNPTIVPYGGAKAALNYMTEALAQQYGPKVRVNTLMPGSMSTDVSKVWDERMVASVADTVAMARLGQPSEIVGAAIYLASNASSYTTGSTIRVDGGIP